MLENVVAKSSSIIAVAMESAGASIQSEMLDFVASGSGQTLAGLLYMIAIVGALIGLASGGNYRWGRYLLVGPVLFFFLTNVRTESDGTEWGFGKETYNKETIEKVLRGVDAPINGGATRVALVYNFWNLFMSEVVHELINLLNLTETNSQFNFVQKIERYMQGWNFSSITNKDLRALIKLYFSAQCRDYFHHLRVSNNYQELLPLRIKSKARADELGQIKSFIIPQDSIGNGVDQDLYDYLKSNGMTNSVYSCQELWEKTVKLVKTDVEETLKKQLTDGVTPEQDLDQIALTYYKLIGQYHETLHGNYQKYINDGDHEAARIYAINRLVARSLYLEINEVNQFSQRSAMTPQTDYYLMANSNAYQKGFNEDVAGSIQQFKIHDRYAQKSLFMTTALSLPYFQGLGLLLLSASYPFFAMLVILPGRAIGFFTWLGMWAWLKLWDLGFAVVMLIDNMLYLMFPNGEPIKDEDLKNAGTAWAKLLEVDPNYSMATYYHLIATCLFAVPLITGIFVKRGGGELVNLIHSNVGSYADLVAGGTVTFARSLQTQGMMNDLQARITQAYAQVGADIQKDFSSEIEKLAKLDQAKKGVETGDKIIDNMSKVMLEAEHTSIKARMDAEISFRLAEARYQVEMSYGQFIANRAVASKYNTHDLVTARKDYYQALKQRDLASNYYDVSSVASGMSDSLKTLLSNATSKVVD